MSLLGFQQEEWHSSFGKAREFEGFACRRTPPRGARLRRMASRHLLACFFACLQLHGVAIAGERWIIGLSTSGEPIEAVAIAARAPSSPTVIFVGGLQRPDQSSDAVVREAAAFEQVPQNRRAFRLIAVARANPDAQPLQFPPSGVAYREHVESHVLWR